MTQSTQDLTKLLVRVGQDTDEKAFRELHEALAPRIKAYMMRQGANGDLSEELAQEVMVKVWRKAHLFSPEKGAATTWAYTIARNLRIDKIRKEYVWQEMPDGYEDTPDQADLPDEQVSIDQRAARVREALRELPPEQVEVIELSFLDGLSHSEIAEKLTTPLGTIKSRMRLAYGRLQEHLTKLH